MTTATERDFIVETIAPADQAGVVEAVRAAHDARRAVYPLGGRTALDYGITPTQTGIWLDLSGLAKVVDYTPRDMTILVEAGVRMADLATMLAAEGQQLPVDVPRASEATIGGVAATNWNGPRRYGYGTIRDYVIGIHAVDGRGVAFKGGGRVVKNVAGYDFCKLLTGSLGTLAVITQLAMKVKPLPEQSATIAGKFADLDMLEAALSRLSQLDAPPVSIDVLAGPAWQQVFDDCGLGHPEGTRDCGLLRSAVVVRVEGNEDETAWLADSVQSTLKASRGAPVTRLTDVDAGAIWTWQIEFADRGVREAADDSPLVLKIAVPPSAVAGIIGELLACDADCAIQAHAGNGIVYVRFAHIGQADLTRVLVGKLRPAAVRLGGSAVVVSSKMEGLTPHMIWGGRNEGDLLLERIKQKFDPNNILNPGRFIL